MVQKTSRNIVFRTFLSLTHHQCMHPSIHEFVHLPINFFFFFCHESPHLVLTTICEVQYHHCLHFTDVETKAQRS